MFKNLLCLMVVAVISIPAQQCVCGDIIFKVKSETTNAGETVGVTITARDEDGTPGNLTAYDLPLLIEGFGTDLTFAGFQSSVFGAAASVITPGVAPFNYQFQVTESDTSAVSPGVTIGAAEVDLVTMNFMVSGTANVGDEFDFSIVTNPTPVASAYNFTGTDLGDEASSGTEGGTVTIAAVPEPSSFALAVLALGGLVVRRRRS